mmetsp:Transcript_41295/g.76915  ORF Transcript_41295/g.76915 Transcript_41295/m.76915 type:complete len:344 (-) Transcript_41295:36-1067(-)
MSFPAFDAMAKKEWTKALRFNRPDRPATMDLRKSPGSMFHGIPKPSVTHFREASMNEIAEAYSDGRNTLGARSAQGGILEPSFAKIEGVTGRDRKGRIKVESSRKGSSLPEMSMKGQLPWDPPMAPRGSRGTRSMRPLSAPTTVVDAFPSPKSAKLQSGLQPALDSASWHQPLRPIYSPIHSPGTGLTGTRPLTAVQNILESRPESAMRMRPVSAVQNLKESKSTSSLHMRPLSAAHHLKPSQSDSALRPLSAAHNLRGTKSDNATSARPLTAAQAYMNLKDFDSSRRMRPLTAANHLKEIQPSSSKPMRPSTAAQQVKEIQTLITRESNYGKRSAILMGLYS